MYIPQSVLLTGGAGFIGSNVLIHLVRKFPECHFVCLDKVSYCSSLKSIEEISDCSNFTFVKGDIGSADLINLILVSHKIDTVMHFAAQSHVDNSFGNSIQFTKDNILGTHVLLESCNIHRDQIRRFIHVSTDEVYGETPLESDFGGKTEANALAPTNPYAATKAGAEYLVKAYNKSFGLPTIITRGNNVFGPRQYPEKLIPKFIHLLKSDMPCPIHGDGTHLRSYVFVEDVAKAFELILTKGEIGAIYNIGTDAETCNIEVFDTLLKIFKKEDRRDELLQFVEDRAFNDTRYKIETSKLKEIGWQPETSFVDGLRATITWYEKNPDHFGDVKGALAAHPHRAFILH